MSRVLPILFNTEMVKAILDGRKTCTRRIIKTADRQEKFIELGHDISAFDKNGEEKPLQGLYATFEGTDNSTCDYPIYKSQYDVNDILYVRETWFRDVYTGKYFYRADGECIDVNLTNGDVQPFGKADGLRWRPSIHMPKEAARIFLKVTGVRAERLQEMEHDAPLKEGIRSYTKDGTVVKFAPSEDWIDWKHMPKNPTTAFKLLWDSTVSKKDLDKYGWNANPWVWVYSFERCDRPEEVEE